MKGGWYGVDLDGTLAVDIDEVGAIGPPIQAMVDRIKIWLSNGEEVRIVTARVAMCGVINKEDVIDDEAFARAQRAKIEAWCLEHIGQVLPVTASKDYMMRELWDDRAVRVRKNTGQRCCGDEYEEGQRGRDS